MNINFERCMLPGQRPSDWTAPAPIDILPALRLCYPGCIDDVVLEVQVVNRIDVGRSNWHFFVTKDFTTADVPVISVTEDRGDGYDFSDLPADVYPSDVILTILQSDRLQALQNTLGIFKPAAFDMMRRIQSDAYESQGDFLRSEHLPRVDFFRRVASHLSEHLASSVDLVRPTVQSLKSEEPFGLRGEGDDSRWMEVGEEAASPSLLHERTLEDVQSIVAENFSELPRPVQVAVWFSTVADGQLWHDDDALSWDFPSGAVDNMDLGDMDEVFNKAARKTMSLAENDYWKSQDKTQAG